MPWTTLLSLGTGHLAQQTQAEKLSATQRHLEKAAEAEARNEHAIQAAKAGQSDSVTVRVRAGAEHTRHSTDFEAKHRQAVSVKLSLSGHQAFLGPQRVASVILTHPDGRRQTLARSQGNNRINRTETVELVPGWYTLAAVVDGGYANADAALTYQYRPPAPSIPDAVVSMTPDNSLQQWLTAEAKKPKTSTVESWLDHLYEQTGDAQVGQLRQAIYQAGQITPDIQRAIQQSLGHVQTVAPPQPADQTMVYVGLGALALVGIIVLAR